MVLKKETLDSYVAIFSKGVTPENFPLVMSDIYMDVMKLKNLTRAQIAEQCKIALFYILDNTDSGEHDAALDAMMKKMIPGLISAFMDIDPSKAVKAACGCLGA